MEMFPLQTPNSELNEWDLGVHFDFLPLELGFYDCIALQETK
jgi:hypothetical protein